MNHQQSPASVGERLAVLSARQGSGANRGRNSRNSSQTKSLEKSNSFNAAGGVFKIYGPHGGGMF